MDEFVVKSPAEANFVKSKRGQDLLVDSFNYMYFKDKISIDGTKCYWRCVFRGVKKSQLKCQGRAVTDIKSRLIMSTKCHNHPSNSDQVRIMYQKQI